MVKHAKIATLLLPGIGTIHDLKNAYQAGARVGARRATHCTEADVSAQHIQYARELGMDTVGFLMMSHMTTPENLAQQAKLMENYGSDLYLCGRFRRRNEHERYSRPLPRTESGAEAGNRNRMHAHHNLSLGVANPLPRVEEGVTVSTPARRDGRRRGQRAIGVFIAAADKLGWQHGTDLYALMDAADDLVRPLQDRPVRVDRETLALGYAGVPSFLRHCEVAAARYDLSAVDILVELGKRRMVGGQEDMIVDVALDLRNRK